MPTEAERWQNYMLVQTAIAGLRTDAALVACIDATSGVLGFASTSVEEADRLVEAIVGDLKKSIRDNWEYTREARARAGVPVAKG